LDIQYWLLKYTSRPQAELFTAAVQTVATLKEYQKFSNGMHIVK
jgi:hypothetical protein